MRVLVVLIGGSSSVEGEVKQGNEEELVSWWKSKEEDCLILSDAVQGKKIVPKSSIGYIVRKR